MAQQNIMKKGRNAWARMCPHRGPYNTYSIFYLSVGKLYTLTTFLLYFAHNFIAYNYVYGILSGAVTLLRPTGSDLVISITLF